MKHITLVITITIIAGLLLTACDRQPSPPQSQAQGQSVIKAEPPSSHEETSPFFLIQRDGGIFSFGHRRSGAYRG